MGPREIERRGREKRSAREAMTLSEEKEENNEFCKYCRMRAYTLLDPHYLEWFQGLKAQGMKQWVAERASFCAVGVE